MYENVSYTLGLGCIAGSLLILGVDCDIPNLVRISAGLFMGIGLGSLIMSFRAK